MENKLTLSVAPHIYAGARTNKIMLTVILALMPSVAVSFVVFGMRSAWIYLATMASCMVFEYLFNKIAGRSNSLKDYSAALTGLLLAMTLPVTVPLWVCVVGGFASIVVAKMVFGGLGSNPFNPAVVGRIFLLISFPVQLTHLAPPRIGLGPDGLSSASVLGSAKTYAQMADGSLEGFVLPNLGELLLGINPGAIGETSVIALLIGGLALIALRIITWHIPVAFLGTVLILTWGHSLMYPDTILPPEVQLLSGGLILGAFFMATDYVTSPLFPAGKIIFGIGCGMITVVIRIFGSYPEGVAFAILLMNAVTPLLDKYLRPRAYGEKR